MIFNKDNEGNPVITLRSVPYNQYDIKPAGLLYTEFDSSSYISALTLSNKSGNTFDYTGTAPAVDDIIYQTDIQNRAYVDSVGVGTVTLSTDRSKGESQGIINNGSATLCKPVDTTYQLGTTDTSWQMWGGYIVVTDYGLQDICKIRILTDGDYYISTMTEYLVRIFEKVPEVKTPDGHPANLPGEYKIQIRYYPTDNSKTSVKQYLDFIITEKME